MYITSNLLLTKLNIFQFVSQDVFIRNVFITPFVQNRTILYQHQSRIRADHRLQCDVVHLAERIFRTGLILPQLYLLFR